MTVKMLLFPWYQTLNYKWHLLCPWDKIIFWGCSVRLFAFLMLTAPELTCRSETGSGLLRVPCSYSCTGGKLLGTHLEAEGGGRGHGPCSHPSLSRLFHSLIVKPHHQTGSHFVDPVPHPLHIYQCQWWLLPCYRNTCCLIYGFVCSCV